MKKIIVLLCSILALSNAKAIATPRPQSNSIKSFTEWCEEKSTLPKATKHTVEVLLKEVETQDCQEANQKLSNLTKLYLQRTQISDLKPLSNLTNLTLLHLWDNKISDVKPLSNLTNLTNLDLWGNKISDVKPLANLTDLTSLNIGGNQISDVKPLAGLTNLTNLDLGGNQISDVTPLASLTNLTRLDFYSNQISDVKSVLLKSVFLREAVIYLSLIDNGMLKQNPKVRN